MKIKVMIEYEFSQPEYDDISEEDLRHDIYKDIEQFYRLERDVVSYIGDSQAQATYFKVIHGDEK